MLLSYRVPVEVNNYNSYRWRRWWWPYPLTTLYSWLLHSYIYHTKAELTAEIKKSPWYADTIPKLVYLKSLSIIQLRLGRSPGRVLKAAIIRGTSLVDWWLAMTRDALCKISSTQSPVSTTVTSKQISLPLKYTKHDSTSQNNFVQTSPCSLLSSQKAHNGMKSPSQWSNLIFWTHHYIPPNSSTAQPWTEANEIEPLRFHDKVED